MPTPIRKWEYHIAQAEGVRINSASDMVEWLDRKDAEGWEFVGMSSEVWASRGMDTWHVFRRPYRSA